MQISRRQLYRKIKLYTGLASNEYVREVRLFEARKLLEERSVRTAAELAYAVGFEDPDYFSRIYMERFGYRPSKEL
jgi:transcriptional regulator GlxA family with amidase domain